MKLNYKLLILAVLVIGGMLLSQWGPATHFFAGPALRRWIEACRSSGWGPAAFVLIFTIGGMSALPAVGFLLLGGAVFGFWPGVAYNFLGCNLAALAAFGISRTLGREVVRGFVQSDKLVKLEAAVERNGFWVIMAIRILPIFPFNLVNYGSGFLKIRFKDYAFGTFAGTLPAVALFSYYGSVPGGGRNGKLEAAVILLALAAVGAATFMMRGTLQKPSSPERGAVPAGDRTDPTGDRTDPAALRGEGSEQRMGRK